MHQPPILTYRSEAFAEDLLEATAPREPVRRRRRLRRYLPSLVLAALGAMLALV